MSGKRIVLLSRLNPKKFGSYEEFLLLLGSELVSKGNEFTVTFSANPPIWLKQKFEENQIGIKVFNFQKKITVVFEMFSFLRKKRPDILLISFISLRHVVIPLARLLRIPLSIYVFHSFNSGKWKPSKNGNMTNILQKISLPLRTSLSVNSIDRFVCVSHFLKEKVVEAFNIPPEKIAVIPNGVNLERFDRLKEDFPLESIANISGNTKIITAIGNLIYSKGFQYLLISFQEVLYKTNNVRLIIVGEGSYMENLKELADNLKISRYVAFLGLRNDIERILQYSDIVVIPSICDEAFCYVLLESMCAGKPVIASRIGAIPELIIEKRTGLFCEAGDAKSISEKILFLLAHPETMEKLGLAARVRARSVGTINKQVERYLNVLEIS